ncbi:MAG: methionine adenosyltransferase [Victivallales bacterium]|nr:methionine adenosyltransferase [Victivallales bacterium]
MHAKHIFTSESVSEGHPDKVCDQISDAVLDACLEQDPDSRVACEALTTTNMIVVSGEITTRADVVWETVTRDIVRKIGYKDENMMFTADGTKLLICIHSQSSDISQGVTEGEGKYAEQGAGDQGMMFGYATNETEELMPAPIIFSHKILQELARRRHEEPEKYPYLRPDSKSQVSVSYENGKPVKVETIVVSHQHTPEAEMKVIEKLVKEVSEQVIPQSFMHPDVKYYINPTGRFEIGGPHGDTGLTGRKIIVDTYGGVGSHGGGAFSGKDPSKVDRSAAYMSRYVAKNVVAAGLAQKCEVQVAYAIGVAEPLSLNVDTYRTGKLEKDEQLEEVLQEVFSFKPANIIELLGLKHPHRNGWCYKDTAAYGHFGREVFPWEKTDKAEELREAAKKHGFKI